MNENTPKCIVRMQEDGTIILPDDFLDSSGLEIGDELDVDLDGERIILTPVGKQLRS